MDLSKPTLRPTGPGRYITRQGEIAIIDAGPTWDSRWIGKIPGLYTKTWWSLNGKHNLFPSDDIVDIALPA